MRWLPAACGDSRRSAHHKILMGSDNCFVLNGCYIDFSVCYLKIDFVIIVQSFTGLTDLAEPSTMENSLINYSPRKAIHNVLEYYKMYL